MNTNKYIYMYIGWLRTVRNREHVDHIYKYIYKYKYIFIYIQAGCAPCRTVSMLTTYIYIYIYIYTSIYLSIYLSTS